MAYRGCLVLITVLQLLATSSVALPDNSRPLPHTCNVDGVGIALCTTIAVPENRATGTGRVIDLNVVLVPALQRSSSDAVTTLTGGPGEAMVEEISLFYTKAQIARMRRFHALLFIDSRGTGRSGNIDCPYLPRTNQDYFRSVLTMGSVAECRRLLTARGVDLNWYRTDAVADDLDDVRLALGFKTLTLVGTSGGTLTALIYARRHPSHVRAMLLGGVNSPLAKIPLAYAPARQYALDRVFAECARAKYCSQHVPNLKGKFNALLSRLSQGPVTVQVAGGSGSVALTYTEFAENVGLMLYSPDTAAQLPRLIDAAYKGRWSPFISAALAGLKYFFVAAPDGISRGFYLSVTCAEDVPFISNDDIRTTAMPTFAGDTRIRPHQAACKTWGVNPVPHQWLQQASSTAPTLIINNRYDPATPLWGAHAALATLPNGRLIVIDQVGHVTDWDCFQRIQAQFVDSANVRTVDASCAAPQRSLTFPATGWKT